MPNYTFFCNDCNESFELFFNIKDYKDTNKCPNCGKYCKRFYEVDMITLTQSVKKNDSELKLGDLANRNRDKMSDDEKTYLYRKHNSYKEEPCNNLPTGMSRIKRPKEKIKWTNSKTINKKTRKKK